VTIFKRLVLLLPVLVLTSFVARADTVYVSGSYAFADPSGSGYAIGPYGGTLNGIAATFFCVDFSHDITGNTSWSATPSLLSSSSLSATLLKNATTYKDIAYILTEMMSLESQTQTMANQTLEAEYQWTIWSMTGGAAQDPYGTAATSAIWADAQNHVNSGWSGAGWEILTPKTGTGYSSNGPIGGYYGQEFMVMVTPEPSSIVLLLAGLAAVFGIALLKR
jgi:hypothetical protein